MNDHEQAVADALSRKGWTVLHRGWPDLLCINWTRIQLASASESEGAFQRLKARTPLNCFFVELKRGGDRVSEHQRWMHTVIRALGFPCHVVREDGLDSLMRKKGTVVTAGQDRKTLLRQIEMFEFKLRSDLLEMERLKKSVEDATVLLDLDNLDEQAEFQRASV